MRFLKTFVLTLALSGTAQAAVTGEALLQLIKGDDEARMGAIGYVIGVVEALSGRVICPAKDSNIEQAMSMVTVFMEQNRQELDKPAIRFVVASLSRAWPCGKSI